MFKGHCCLSVWLLVFFLHTADPSKIWAQTNCPSGTGSNLLSGSFYTRDEGPKTDLFGSPLNPTPPGYKIAYPSGHTRRPEVSDDNTYIQDLINTAGDYGAVYFWQGDYYLSDIKLREGITLLAQAGTRFLGTTGHLEGWSLHTSNVWKYRYDDLKKIYDPISPTGENTYRCADRNSNTCKMLQDLFIDAQWLTQVESLAELDQQNEWFFDDSLHYLFLYSPVAPDNLNATVELSVKDRAFYYDPNSNNARSSDDLREVEIQNIIFYGYNYQSLVSGSKWVIKNCTFRNNHLTGFNVRGDSALIKHNLISYNGGNGMSCNETRYAEVRENEIAWNNRALYDGSWQAGGLKASGSRRLKISNNYVHHNNNVGLWVDNLCKRTEVFNNWLEYNVTAIQYELSDSGKIYNNTFLNNEWYGIYALCSPNLEIYKNTIDGARNGIIVRQDNRGIKGNCIVNPGLAHCEHQVRNVYVHHNQVTVYQPDHFPAGFTLINCTSTNCGDSAWKRYFSKDYNVLFDYNQYRYARGNVREQLSSDKAFYWSLDSVLFKPLAYSFQRWSTIGFTFQDKHSCIAESTGEAPSGREPSASDASASNKDTGNEVMLYPVPCKDYLIIQLREVIDREMLHNTRLYFINAMAVRFDVLSNDIQYDGNTITVDVQKLPRGMYTLHIFSGKFLLKSARVIKN